MKYEVTVYLSQYGSEKMETIIIDNVASISIIGEPEKMCFHGARGKLLLVVPSALFYRAILVEEKKATVKKLKKL